MATIKDIAERSGCSVAAVSRILNQDSSLSVKPETRQRVLDAARELNYKKKLPDEPKTVFGIFQWTSEFQEMEDPYYQSIRMGIEKYCANRQLDVLRVYQSDPDYMEALKNVDALICIGKFSEQKIEQLKGLTPHVLFVDMKTRKIHCHTISLDLGQAVMDAMDYLYGLGHRSVAWLGGEEVLSDESVYFEERKAAFIRYCEDHEILWEPFIREEGFSSEAGYHMAKDLLAAGLLPTAVFAASDPIALGAMRAFYEAGLKIPEDISILGFDDISMAAYCQPPLTTVHAPSAFMGEYAAHYIHLLSKTGTIEYQTPVRLMLPCSLKIRKSCCPPAETVSEDTL